MPSILAPDHPHLQQAVHRLRRSHWIWGGVLIGLGLLTQIVLLRERPIGGLPFFILGFVCLFLRDPALLATVSVLIALSIPSYFHPNLHLLGPDPLPELALLGTGTEELSIFSVIFALGKVMLAYMAFNQFLLMRFLYGTATAQIDDPKAADIPALVPNRIFGQTRWSLWLGLLTVGALVATLISSLIDRSGDAARLGAEITGNLGAVALGLGVGAAFSPNPHRTAAVLGAACGLLGYAVGFVLLLLLPIVMVN